MTDANFRFMSRQLLLSELGGESAGEESGLLIGHGPDVWVAISDLESVSDPEEMVEACRQYAADTNGRLAGMLMLYEPSQGSSDEIRELDEAMYLLDLPRREVAVPDLVQLMFSPPKGRHGEGLELRQADWQDADAQALLAEGLEAPELISGPALSGHAGWPQLLECNLLLRDGKPVALSGCINTELASRLAYILVDPLHRREGLGSAMVAQLAQAAQQQGKMLMSCWTQRSGHLRYFTNKAGFEDRLGVRWYMPAP